MCCLRPHLMAGRGEVFAVWGLRFFGGEEERKLTGRDVICMRLGVGQACMTMRLVWWCLGELCVDFFLARVESEPRILTNVGAMTRVRDVVC